MPARQQERSLFGDSVCRVLCDQGFKGIDVKRIFLWTRIISFDEFDSFDVCIHHGIRVFIGKMEADQILVKQERIMKIGSGVFCLKRNSDKFFWGGKSLGLIDLERIGRFDQVRFIIFKIFKRTVGQQVV